MKWFLVLLIFIAGAFYLVNRHRASGARRQETARQAARQDDLLKEASGETEELPARPEKAYIMRFSMQTLKTLRNLTSDPNEKVRFAAVELLWQLQDEQAPAIIKHMFQEETDPGVKKNLLEMLARDKSRISLALLAEAMNDDYDKETRLKAVEAIGDFSNKEAIAVLNKALEDYDEEVRLKAVEAVNRIRRDIETNKEQQLKDLKGKPLFRVE